ncbi:MAG: hypothetical protein PVH28_07380 [Desulfobacterales bacterium]|jgi:hypothetical protein
MISRAFACICAALLFFGVPGAFPQDDLQKAPPKETKTTENPVILGKKILFYLATEDEEMKLAKRAEEVSERIKKIADSTSFTIDSIRTIDFNGPLTFIVAGDKVITAILDKDAVSKEKSRQQLAAEYSQVYQHRHRKIPRRPQPQTAYLQCSLYVPHDYRPNCYTDSNWKN